MVALSPDFLVGLMSLARNQDNGVSVGLQDRLFNSFFTVCDTGNLVPVSESLHGLVNNRFGIFVTGIVGSYGDSVGKWFHGRGHLRTFGFITIAAAAKNDVQLLPAAFDIRERL